MHFPPPSTYRSSRLNQPSPFPRSSNSNCNCAFCGYSHPHPVIGNVSESRSSPNRSPSGGGGNPPPGGGDGKKDTGRDGGKGAGDCGKPDKKDMPIYTSTYLDKMPASCTKTVFYIGVFIVVFCVVFGYACLGTSSPKDCVDKYSGSCDQITNPNLRKALTNSSECCNKRNYGSSSLPAQIPSVFREKYENFKKAVKNNDCHKQNSADCLGVANYAGKSAGGTIKSIRDTIPVLTRTGCKCTDSSERQHLPCVPGAGGCSNCKCKTTEYPAGIILTEEDPLTLGECWAFDGVGKVLLELYYPLLVTGVSLRHPAKARLVDGSFAAAPKDFEVWGYKNPEDTAPFHFGTFQYTEKDLAVKIYEVKNLSAELFRFVQFNFLTNHGQSNYSVVYRVGVHGLMNDADKLN